MKRLTYAVLLLSIITAAFLAGSWSSHREHSNSATSDARGLPHHVDPIYQSHTSHNPGIAPNEEPSQRSAIPGMVKINPEKQQLIGVRVSPVEKTSSTHLLRLLGRVAPDETRIYRLNAGIDGTIREVSAVTTGSQVKKDQLLATFSAPNATSVINMYIVNSGAAEHVRSTAEGSLGAQAGTLAAANIRQRIDQLQNLGMSALQMEEIRQTGEFPESIKILAPANGFVLARNVSPGLKFERGAEWYRIANLRRVWILVDLFENDAPYLRPGARAQMSLPHLGKRLPARVSEVLPLFDAATRTLKARLEADNPDYLLRPDMFVDVELPITLAPTIAVPSDAVFDSGRKQTVFVDRGEGFFEPRQVETGWRFGDRIEIVKGLTPGERIVISGAFLLDSESRMRPAVADPAGSHQQPAVQQADGSAAQPHTAHH